jgi:hypothetical protein
MKVTTGPLEVAGDRTGTSLWPLAPVAVVLGAAGIVYGVSGSVQSSSTVLVSTLSLLIAAGAWLRSDAERHRIAMVFDWGFLVGAAWPLLLPLYAYRTRGGKGWRLIVLVFAAMFAPQIGTVVGEIIRVLVGAGP